MEPMRLELVLQEVPVTLVEKGGEEKSCVIREMSGAGRDKYLTGQKDRMKVVKGKVTGVRSFEGIQSDLISRCLFEGEELVPEEEIRKYPASVQNALFKAAQKLNALDEEKEKEAKND